MASVSSLFYSMNYGEVSSLALARTDIAKLRMSAALQVNWLPRTVGPMMLRPGTAFIGEIFEDRPARTIPFVVAFADTAVLELTDSVLRVWVNDQLVTRNQVATVIPGFDPADWVTDLTGTAQATFGADELSLNNVNAGATATATATVAIAAQDQPTEHAIRFQVTAGALLFRIGSAIGLDDVFKTELLGVGLYSLAFTPGVGVDTIYPQFATTAQVPTSVGLDQLPVVTVKNVAIEAPGIMALPTPWPEAMLPLIRFDTSADVMYLACKGVPQQQINRYSPTSWSVVLYQPFKGPFAQPGDASTLLAPTALWGNFSIIANKPAFKASDVGTLLRLSQNGHAVNYGLSAQGTATDAIRVTGVSYTSTIDGGGNVVNTPSSDRQFSFLLTGAFDAVVTLQRSYTSGTEGFTDFNFYAAPVSQALIDGLSNEIVWYRWSIDQGNYVSGVAGVGLSYGGDAVNGVALVTGYVSPTEVKAASVVPFGQNNNSTLWYQSQWNSVNGWPSSVAIHEGRLFWSGADFTWGSVSDDYTNFDIDAIGDAAPIIRSVGTGPIANINWLLSMNHLMLGADTSVIAARSDSIDSPLTPTNFNLKPSVTNGAAPLQAKRIDERAVYVDSANRRLYELIYDLVLYNYKPNDLTRLNPDIGIPGFVDIDVQRQPDTRIHVIRADGQVACLLYDVNDDVIAWWRMQTAGNFENVARLPGLLEDQMYYVVKRTIGGKTRRFLEKSARIDECQGGLINKNIDCHVVFQVAAGADPVLYATGGVHLAGQTVVIWGDGADLGTAVVDGNGGVQLSRACRNVVFGLPYVAQFVSTKLAYGAQLGTAVNRMKRVDHIGLVLAYTHYQGVQYGSYIANPTVAGAGFSSGFSSGFQTNQLWNGPEPLSDLPQVENGVPTPVDTVWIDYDKVPFEHDGTYDPDARIVLQAASPRPATVVGLTLDLSTAG